MFVFGCNNQGQCAVGAAAAGGGQSVLAPARAPTWLHAPPTAVACGAAGTVVLQPHGGCVGAAGGVADFADPATRKGKRLSSLPHSTPTRVLAVAATATEFLAATPDDVTLWTTALRVRQRRTKGRVN